MPAPTDQPGQMDDGMTEPAIPRLGIHEKLSLEAMIGEVVLDSQRRADSLAVDARRRADQAIGEAEMRRRAVEDESRQILGRLREAATSIFVAADQSWNVVRADTRARLLERIDELDRDLHGPEPRESNESPQDRPAPPTPERVAQDPPSPESRTGPALPPPGDSWYDFLLRPRSESSAVSADLLASPAGSSEVGTLEGEDFARNLLEPTARAFETDPCDDPTRRIAAAVWPPKERWRQRCRRSVPGWASAGAWIRNGGVLVMLFCAYQVWGTGVLSERSQIQLRAGLYTDVALPERSDLAQGAIPVIGGAVAVLEIPQIALNEVVVEGWGAAELRRGPGHDRRSPLPGAPGNSVIAGHRVTYGGAFGRLGDLGVGSVVLASRTGVEPTVYTVSEQPMVVPRDGLAPVVENHRDRLTLITSHPRFGASGWLVVVAEPDQVLRDDGGIRPATQFQFVGAPLGEEGRHWIAVLMWSVLFIPVRRTFRWLAARSRRVAFMVTVPLGMIIVVGGFNSLDRLMPSAL